MLSLLFSVLPLLVIPFPTQQEFGHPTQAPCVCPLPVTYSNSAPSFHKTFCDGTTNSPGEPAVQYSDNCSLEILGCSHGYMIETEELKDAPVWLRHNTTAHCRGEATFNRVLSCDPENKFFFFVDGNKFLIYSVSCF